MSDPMYDGLCGIPMIAPTRDGKYLRCRFEFGHYGDHDWENKEKYFHIQSYCGVNPNPYERYR